MNEFQDLLERRAHGIEPASEALQTILRTVGRRRRTRRVLSAMAATALIAAGTVAVAAPMLGHAPTKRSSSGLPPVADALSIRKALGIEGPTKGAPQSVVVRHEGPGDQVQLSLVKIQTGQATPLPRNARDATVSPNGGAVAVIRNDRIVVAPVDGGGAPAEIPRTAGAGGGMSWDSAGGALFTRVRDRWVSVSNAIPPNSEVFRHVSPVVRRLDVPAIPGGPIVLSVSPGGDLALLFGVTYRHHGEPHPHLFLGRFDGTAVTGLTRIEVPRGAVDGPMGWLGQNAFLLAPADGEALIVRIDGTRVPVNANPMANPCDYLPPADGCTRSGPRLLGTNDGGSLLFWRLAAEPAGNADAPAGEPSPIVLYYKTWLDGTHAIQLTGTVGVYGPPLAAR